MVVCRLGHSIGHPFFTEFIVQHYKKEKTFVLSSSNISGYTECFMSYGCNYRKWFLRPLQSKMFLSTWVLCLMVMLPWAFFLILINALLWTASTRKATLNNLCFRHWMADHANRVQAYLLQVHSQPSSKGRLGWKGGFGKPVLNTCRYGLRQFLSCN